MVVLKPPPFRKAKELEYVVPPAVRAELEQTPWTLSTLRDPAFIPLDSYSRTPPPYLAGRYSLMSKTLKTDQTVPIWQGFYRPSTSDDDPGELRVIASLGPGMDGHLHTAHGGVAATLLDEALGTLAGIHKEPGKSIFTGFIHVDYKKPVPTPGVILIRACLNGKKSANRKIFVEATLESGEGVVYSRAESLFVEVERKHKHKSKI
jgi:thioesterase superfamily protein 4